MRAPLIAFLITMGFVTSCGVIIDQPGLSERRAFAKDAVATTATVTHADPEQHNGVSYKYVVNGKTYYGGGFAGEQRQPRCR